MRLFFAICIVWILSIISYATYELVQPTSCDDNCTELIREYQLQIEMEEILVFDGHRYVGTLPYDATQRLDSLITEDNR